MKTKSFVCLHGFGNHPGGRRPGFSAALRRSVESRLGAPVLWREVLWDGLLGSPDSFRTMDLMLQTRHSPQGSLRPAILVSAACGVAPLRVCRTGQWHLADDGSLIDPMTRA